MSNLFEIRKAKQLNQHSQKLVSGYCRQSKLTVLHTYLITMYIKNCGTEQISKYNDHCWRISADKQTIEIICHTKKHLPASCFGTMMASTNCGTTKWNLIIKKFSGLVHIGISTYGGIEFRQAAMYGIGWSKHHHRLSARKIINTNYSIRTFDEGVDAQIVQNDEMMICIQKQCVWFKFIDQNKKLKVLFKGNIKSGDYRLFIILSHSNDCIQIKKFEQTYSNELHITQ